MFKFFDVDIIPTFLSRFKVKKVLAIGLSNKLIANEIIGFCINNQALLCAIDSEINVCDLIKESYKSHDIDEYINGNVKHFKEGSLDILPNLEPFDAVFINDDPNWYTVYNELDLIKKNNSNFPLVFVCNNKYPHKRRDSYINPDNIPNEYKNECCNELPIIFEEGNEIKHAMVSDGFCHAIYQNTPKNGVLTAIEDFLKENPSLKLLDINPFEGITLIYNDTSIAYIRVDKIFSEEKSKEYNLGEFSDKFIENNLLLNHVVGINLIKEDIDRINEYKSEIEDQNSLLEDYENRIEISNAQIGFKDSQINNIKTQIGLTETQLQSAEATLLNKNNEIKLKDEELASKDIELQNAKNKLSKTNNEYSIIENKYKELIELNKIELENNQKEIENNKNKLSHLDNQLQSAEATLLNKNNEIKLKDEELASKDIELQNAQNKYDNLNNRLDTLKLNYDIQSGKIKNKEYCISCYKEEIRNNEIEIEYIKKSDKFSKKILAPLAYGYIILKSKPSEIITNIKLYKSLKNSKCFDIGYYLNKYPDISKSKWCKYFSPELHYVCEGFNEKRKFNKKFFKNHDKKELIENIKN